MVRVESEDPNFTGFVERELDAMRSGKRGIVSRSLIDRLDSASAVTTIRPLTKDESTWHPNDLKGTRSHVVPKDTRVRGAERAQPTDADVYIHPPRVDPSMSLFKVGTFVHELALAADLNQGTFPADYRVREKRASFYRNAWLESLGLKPIAVSDRVPTPEYQDAKAKGLISEDNIRLFPILSSDPIPAVPAETIPAD